MANNNEVKFDINAVVSGNQDVLNLQEDLAKLGDNSEGVSSQIEELTQTVDDLSEAFKLSESISASNKALEESEEALSSARAAYEETAEAARQLNEAGTPDPVINARLRQQANEVGRLETANRRALNTQRSSQASYEASSESVRRLVDNEQELRRVIEQTREAQGSLNEQMQRALDVMGAREELGLNEAQRVQDEIQRISDQYRILAESGTLTAEQLEQAHGNMEEQLRRLRGETEQATESLGSMVTKAVSFAAVAKGFADVTKEAVEFESAMADVSKFLDWDKQQIDGLSQSLIKLSTEIPISAKGLAEIASAGAQIGLNTTADIAKFTTMVAKMATAFDMSTDAAGKSLAVLKTVFGLTIDQVENLGNAINQLSNTSGQDASAIIETLSRMGGTAQSIGLAADEAAALAAALLSVGKSPEIAGTALNSFLGVLNTATSQGVDFKNGLNEIGMSAVQLAQEIKENPQVAIENLLSKFDELSKIDSAKSSEIIQKMFGKQQAAHIETLVKSLSKLKEQFRAVGDDAQYAGSVQKEFEARMATTAAQLQLLQNGFQNMSINIGSAFLPAINDVAKGLGSMADAIATVAKEYPVITKLIVSITLISTGIIALTAAYRAMVVPALAAFNTTPLIRYLTQVNLIQTAVRGVGTTAKWAGGIFAAWEVGKVLGGVANDFEFVRVAANRLVGDVMRIAGAVKDLGSGETWDNVKKNWKQAGDDIADLSDKQRKSTIAQDKLEAENAKKRKEEVDALAKKKQDAADAEIERLKNIESQVGRNNIAYAKSFDGKLNEEFAWSIKRVDESLQKVGLTFDAVSRGFTEGGNNALSAVRDLRDEAAATSDIIKTVFVESLGQIQTPQELTELRSIFESMATDGKITGKDLEMLQPIFLNIGAAINEGLTPGAEFDNQLKNWATNASNTAKGIATLTAEQQKLTTEIEKEITLINALSEAHITDLKSQIDLAKAKGETWKVTELTNKLSIAELDLSVKLMGANKRKLEVDKQVLAGLNAKVARNEKLTESEKEQKAALELAIIENETAIKVYERSIEVKKMEAQASGQVIAGNEGIAKSASEAASAVDSQAASVGEATKEAEKAAETMSYNSGNIAGSARNWEMISSAAKQALRDTTKYFGHLPQGSAAARDQAKEITKQVEAYDRLSDKIIQATEMTDQQVESTLKSINQLNKLDQTKLQSLRDQLEKFKNKSEEATKSVTNLAQTAQDEITKATQKLDELTGKNRKNVQSEQLRLESAAAEAAAQGNMEAAEKFLEAARLQAEIVRQERLAVQRKQNEEKRKQDEARPTERIQVDLFAETGEKATVYADDKLTAQSFIGILKQSKRNAIRR